MAKSKSKVPKKQIVTSANDKIGNILSKWSDGSITLKLASENGRIRNLGYIDGDTYYTNRKFSHLHYKTKSYGFNYMVLKNGVSFNWVLLTLEDGNSYRIPKNTILEFGKVMYFKTTEGGDSFEVQIFLPTSIIYMYNTKKNGEANTEIKF
jgi:hypothetical protein